jgi:hypothetical protein
MLSRKLSARIAAILLIIHGLIEIYGLWMPERVAHNLQFFGGMDQSQIAANSISIVLLGAIWGATRWIAAWGIWILRKWAIVLGILMSVMTNITALSIVPAGVVDTFLTTPVLMLLLYTWFGNEKKEIE